MRDATNPKSACPQRDLSTKKIIGSEYCLYLNVYRPQLATSEKRLPVMVFIHGGSFKGGSADPELYGPDYFMDTQEVIVVSSDHSVSTGSAWILGGRSRELQGKLWTQGPEHGLVLGL